MPSPPTDAGASSGTVPATALVLAGTRAGGDPLAAYAGVSHKALIEIGGRPMIERVVAALTALPEIRRVLVAIDRPALLRDCELVAAGPREVPVDFVPTASGPSASVGAVLQRIGAPLLVTTADHALLQPAWIRDFIRHVPPDCDAAALLAPRAAVLAALPETRRTWLRFADGAWSGCNLFLLRTAGALRAVRFWQSLEAERKHPARLVRRLGFGFALRYRLRRLTLAEALARVQALCGARVGIVESAFGLAAVDVDKPDDLDLVRRIVAGRAGATAPVGAERPHAVRQR